jgi:hypothetical protein
MPVLYEVQTALLPHFICKRTPKSWRVMFCSFCSFFSTTLCVAMPAWSVPGTHSTLKPLMRRQRTMVSCKHARHGYRRQQRSNAFGLPQVELIKQHNKHTGPRHTTWEA